MSDAFTTRPGNPPASSPTGAGPRVRWRTWQVLLLAGTSFLLGILVGIYLPGVLGPAPQGAGRYVTKDTFAKIKPGMTYGEVQEFFGDAGFRDEGSSNARGSFIRRWQRGRSAIIITFEDGKVTE